MTDYTQEVAPPNYRNLVINPSGENAIAATWYGSNGVVDVGNTDVAPVVGVGVVRYTAGGGSSRRYFVAPFGPNESVHHSAFKVPRAQTVSAAVKLRSSVDLWVSLQAEFKVWDGTNFTTISVQPISAATNVVLDPTDNNGAVDPLDPTVWSTGTADGAVDPSDSSVYIPDPSFGAPDPVDSATMVTSTTSEGATPVSQIYVTTPSEGTLDGSDPNVFNANTEVTPEDSAITVLGGGGYAANSYSTKLTGGAGWQSFIGFGSSNIIPTGATHWSLLISVSGSDPSGTANLTPSIGAHLYVDQTMVPDSGVSLTGVPYVDGSITGAYWEGEPNYSTSHTGVKPDSDVDPGDPADTDPTEPDDGTGTPPDDDDVPDTPPVIVPEKPPYVYPLTTVEVAERVLAWRNTPEHLCLKSDIQLANLRLNNVDEDGVVWIVSDVEGWWTLPEPDVPDMPRGWFDGSYETRGRYAARGFTITGSFIPSHPASVPRARDRLVQAMNLCHRGDWFMTHEDATAARTDTKGSKVWLSGAPLVSTVNATGRTDFSIGLRAPDPVKYRLKDGVPPGYESLILSTNNRIDFPERGYPRTYPWAFPPTIFGSTDESAVNYGNTVVWPILRLKGPTKGPVVVTNADTHQRLRIVQKLAESEELVINCFTKEVTLNDYGNYRFYLDLDADWLMLQPGPNRLYFEEETFGAQRTDLEVQWRSGWIG